MVETLLLSTLAHTMLQIIFDDRKVMSLEGFH